jgi:hypothetical protein
LFTFGGLMGDGDADGHSSTASRASRQCPSIARSPTRRVGTPGCQDSYMDHTGSHQFVF